MILMYARMYILRSILRLRATSGCQMNANRLQLLRAKRASGEFNGTDFLSLSLSTYIYSAGHQESRKCNFSHNVHFLSNTSCY